MKRLFFGGIHPKYNKEMSKTVTFFQTIYPKQVIIPMQQHIGAPCQPLVSVGDRVLRGQKIGDGEGLCVPVHASVSGTVVAIEPRPHTSGRMVNAIVIENDFQDETVPEIGCELPLEQLDAETVLHTIREAGIVGMGGAAFPGNVKALSSMGKIDTLIANACECEPYITADDSLLRTEPEHVLEGMQIGIKLCRAFNADIKKDVVLTFGKTLHFFCVHKGCVTLFMMERADAEVLKTNKIPVIKSRVSNNIVKNEIATLDKRCNGNSHRFLHSCAVVG